MYIKSDISMATTVFVSIVLCKDGEKERGGADFRFQWHSGAKNPWRKFSYCFFFLFEFTNSTCVLHCSKFQYLKTKRINSCKQCTYLVYIQNSYNLNGMKQ